MANRTTLADALHQAEHLAEAETAFHEAEEMQKKNRPEFPLLYSLRGFRYCDLLLSQGKVQEVVHRAEQTLEWYKKYGATSLHDIAIYNLSIGRAHLLQSQREPNHPFTESLTYLNRAVDGLRQANDQEYIACGLLARAEYYRVTGALDKAQKDLDEAFTIATRGGMGLFLADCHLGYARLFMSLRGGALPTKQPPDGKEIASSQSALLATTYKNAREHLKTAKEMIEKMGYHRRDKEVEELGKEIENR